MANVGPPVGEVRHIAKLNLLNWGSWRYGISILLERSKLFRVTLRQELKPAEILNDAGVVTNQALIDVWDQKDVDARMIIYCNIEPQLQVLVEGVVQLLICGIGLYSNLLKQLLRMQTCC
ncbi:uncharacterized protein LOC123474586 [Daphnia magna]|uniref:uncharacterized protein LOC123474586 n=1 Tax=Daphnia magna TaxID=35525 RepID=UPI001E1B9FCF|nr:uncharacterized protein LOC123474586 [Daphnia magna]